MQRYYWAYNYEVTSLAAVTSENGQGAGDMCPAEVDAHVFRDAIGSDCPGGSLLGALGCRELHLTELFWVRE